MTAVLAVMAAGAATYGSAVAAGSAASERVRPGASARARRVVVGRARTRDRAATLAYLKADLAYEETVVADASASTESVEALAGRLDGECPGVVAGIQTRFNSGARQGRSSRQQGEEVREHRQWGDLAAELDRAMALAREKPNRAAVLSFAAKVRQLRWSDARVTAYEHASAAVMEWEAQGAAPPVCADLRAWMLSGRRAITSQTKALAREREAVRSPVNRLVERMQEASTLSLNPLSRYEGPAAKALAQRIGDVQERQQRVLAREAKVSDRILLAVGAISEAEVKTLAETAEELNEDTVARGTTAAGGRYTVQVLRQPPARLKAHAGAGGLSGASPRGTGCRLDVAAQEVESFNRPVEGVGDLSTACLSRTHPFRPQVRCYQGRRVIEAQTLTDARRVRLSVSDGARIVSRVAIVPRRLGGPAGFYYQAVRSSTGRPVSLTELDRRARPLVTVRLPRGPRCAPRAPFPSPRQERKLTHGRVPGGPAFTIIAKTDQFGGPSLRGPALAGSEIELKIELSNESEAGGIEQRPSGRSGRGPLALAVKTGCEPRSFAILLGLLSEGSDTVWARTASGLTQLRRARIPASLRARGLPAYAALPAVPNEVIVRAPDGKTVQTIKLTGTARAARETCEGEAEA